MAVSAIQSLSDLTSLLGSRAASVRTAGTLTQSLPALANPDVVVSLGGNPTRAITYDASGLLRGLQGLQQAGTLPTGANPGSADSNLQVNLETVLGFDSTAGRLGGADPAVAAGLSSDSRKALINVLAANDGASGTAADQALQEVLSRALSGLAGQTGTTAANAAVNASGILSGTSADNANAALDALSSSRLDLAASALGVNGSNTTTSSIAITSDSATSVFNRLMSSRLEQAVAEADPTRPRQRRTSAIGSADLLLSGTSLLGSVAESASAAVDTGESLTEIALAAQISPESLLRQSIRPLPERATAQNLSAAADGNVTPASRPTTTSPARPMQIEDATPGSTTATATAAATPTPQSVPTPTAAASAEAVRQPRYAEIAAAMTMGAAVYRFQAIVSTTVPPGEVAPERTVQSIRAVAEAKAVH